MDSAKDNHNLQQEEVVKAKGICNCSCQAENALLRAEVVRLQKLLENHAGDNLEHLILKKSRTDRKHMSNEAQSVHGFEQNHGSKASGSQEPVQPEEAFTNVVLRKIWSYLPVKDLLVCRLVCKAWKASASSVLRKRSAYLTDHVADVPRLIAQVNGNPGFPFLGYQWGILYQAEQRDNGMKAFLSEFSHLFKRLRLHAARRFLDMTALEGSSESSIHHEVPRLKELRLPKLEVLLLPPPGYPQVDSRVPEFFRDLIKAAPNLRTIVGFAPELAMALESAGKRNAVTSMNFGNFGMTAPLRNVALNPPCRLSKLEIERMDEWRFDADLQNAIGNAFIAVLSANRETLKSLAMSDLGTQLQDMPVFLKLQNLHIKGNPNTCPKTYDLFPRSVSDFFPALTSVTLEFVSFWDHAPNNATQGQVLRRFLWDEPLSSVTSLTLRFTVKEDGLEFLGEVFPNVTQVWMDWETCRLSNSAKYRGTELWDLWKVPFRLQRLEIHSLNPWANEHFSLDSFLTGIPETICKNLRHGCYAELPMDSSYYDALRGYPSMLYLQDSLSELVISIDYPPTLASRRKLSEDEAQDNSIVSAVSSFYGIQFMKNNLQVYLSYDHRKFYSSTFKKFFAPIEKDVTIIHQDFMEPCPMAI